MKKTLKITLLFAIALFAFATVTQAYTADFSGTPTSVNSGDTFTVKITVDEATTLANSHITYDSSLFTFVEAKQTNLSASVYNSEGEVSWMYTDLNANSTGVKTFEFTFKAANVTEDKTGVFTMSDAVFITVGEKTYEGTNVKGDKNISVTVKAKNSSNTSKDNNTSSSSLSSKNNTTKTNGSSTNKTSATTTYTNTDNTKTNSTTLPKTGMGLAKSGILFATIGLAALAIVFKSKAKNLF